MKILCPVCEQEKTRNTHWADFVKNLTKKKNLGVLNYEHEFTKALQNKQDFLCYLWYNKCVIKREELMSND